MQLSDLFSIIGLGGVAVGLFLNVWAVHRGNAQKRAEFMINLYNQFSNEDILDLYYRIESGKLKKRKLNSKDEYNLDRMLAIFDNIGHLRHTGNFRKSDLFRFR